MFKFGLPKSLSGSKENLTSSHRLQVEVPTIQWPKFQTSLVIKFTAFLLWSFHVNMKKLSIQRPRLQDIIPMHGPLDAMLLMPWKPRGLSLISDFRDVVASCFGCVGAVCLLFPCEPVLSRMVQLFWGLESSSCLNGWRRCMLLAFYRSYVLHGCGEITYRHLI